MSASVTTLGENLIRSTGNVSDGSDYTISFWWRATAAHTDAVILYLGNDPITFYTSYVLIYVVNSGGAKIKFSVGLNGATQDLATLSPYNVDQWYRIAYVRSGTAQRFYFDGALIGTVTSDLSTATDPFDTAILFDDGYGAASADQQIAYAREWSVALTLPQLVQEWAHQTPVVTSNLWSDATFQVDGSDDSGNNRDWTPTGSTAFITLPTSGTSPGTATEILLSTCLVPLSPYTDTQDVWNAGAQDTWYKVTNDLVDGDGPVDATGVFWCYGIIPDTGTSYNPQSNGYFDPEGISQTIGTSFPNNPIVFSILAGESVYFSCETVRSVGAAILNVTCLAHITGPPYGEASEDGNVFITSASTFFDYYIERQGFICAFISPIDEEIYKFLPFLITTEQGDTLASGVKAFVDEGGILPDQPTFPDKYVGFYNQDFSYLTKTIFTGGSVASTIRTCWGAQKFVIIGDLTGVLPLHVYVMLADGSLETDYDLPVTVGSFALSAHCMTNNESSILVGGSIGGGGRIDECTISTRVEWAAAEPNYRINDILILENDQVIVLYQNTTFTNPDMFIRRYASDGVLQETITLTFDEEMASTHARLGYSADMDYVWLLAHEEPVDLTVIKKNVIRKIAVVGGVYLYDFKIPNLLDLEREHADPPLIYASDTCPIIELMSEVVLGTIIVNKVVVGTDTNFDFTTIGLTPDDFSLTDGGSQSFIDLEPGTYGVTETENVLYTTTYEVSNDDPHEAITIVGGETVTVTVTNTEIPPPAATGGIYKVVPWSRKPEDTLWTDVSAEETFDVKIPDPTFRLPLLGD